MKSLFQETILKGLERKGTDKVIVLVSGGVESTAACILLRDAGYDAYGLFMNYGQPNYETERYIVNKLLENGIIQGLEEHQIDIGRIKEAHSDKAGWIPARNTIFMAIAGCVAEREDADAIAIGFAKMDQGVFGDNDIIHHTIMESVLTQSLGRVLKVFLPCMEYDKKHLLDLCNEFNLQTVSCWNAELIKNGKQDVKIEVCGTCPNCLERAECE